jgi:hypothetical protein
MMLIIDLKSERFILSQKDEDHFFQGLLVNLLQRHGVKPKLHIN